MAATQKDSQGKAVETDGFPYGQALCGVLQGVLFPREGCWPRLQGMRAKGCAHKAQRAVAAIAQCLEKLQPLPSRKAPL